MNLRSIKWCSLFTGLIMIGIVGFRRLIWNIKPNPVVGGIGLVLFIIGAISLEFFREVE